jgi:hypothetical protein
MLRIAHRREYESRGVPDKEHFDAATLCFLQKGFDFFQNHQHQVLPGHRQHRLVGRTRELAHEQESKAGLFGGYMYKKISLLKLKID